MIRYIKFEGNCYYTATDFEEYLKTDMSDKELDEYAKELMELNARSYEYLVFGWAPNIEDIAEEENCSIEEAEIIYQDAIDDYYDSCECSWSIITEEEYRESIEDCSYS